MRILTIMLAIFIIFACEADAIYKWENNNSLKDLMHKSNAEKIIIDFETEWCGWCKKLDQITFKDRSVINYANDHFISIKIDAEKGEGKDLTKKYNVTGYPTILFVDDKGNEIDRILGYISPKPYLNELKRIQSGRNTLPALLTSFQNNPESFSTLYKLAKKYEAMGEVQSAKKMINAILAANIDSAGTAKFFKILYESRETGDPIQLLGYIDETKRGSYVASAVQEAMNLTRRNGSDPTLEANLFLQLINLSEYTSPSMLNSFAWRMSELEINLDLAYEKVNIAIAKADDVEQKYMFIDTKAEVLWKQNRTKDAIFEIEKCISKFPENKYYKEQLLKFQNSIDI